MKRTLATVAFAGAALIATNGIAHQNNQNGQDNYFHEFNQAQQRINDAIERVANARSVYGDDFGGHASRAQALLRQAQSELNAAVEYRNSH